MGGYASSLFYSPSSSSSRDQIIADAFAAFVDANCVRGSDKCVHIQKLESAFAFYLDENGISVKRWWSSTLDVVHGCMPPMLVAYGMRMSPGYRYARGENMSVVELDTRYVVGMDVVRFQK